MQSYRALSGFLGLADCQAPNRASSFVPRKVQLWPAGAGAEASDPQDPAAAEGLPEGKGFVGGSSALHRGEVGPGQLQRLDLLCVRVCLRIRVGAMQPLFGQSLLRGFPLPAPFVCAVKTLARLGQGWISTGMAGRQGISHRGGAHGEGTPMDPEGAGQGSELQTGGCFSLRIAGVALFLRHLLVLGVVAPSRAGRAMLCGVLSDKGVKDRAMLTE